ncbi:MAG TPA: DNA polymerase, partial [Ktedonobacterales bacterium]|nr:DNA polymerase [Ktedonobacterales bacterium]
MQHLDEDEWLWGWDATPGIVSVWAERNGRAVLWRRAPGGGALTREEDRFRPWLLLPSLDDLAHLGARLLPEGAIGTELPGVVAWRELSGEGQFRYLVSATDGRTLDTAVMTGASARLGRQVLRLAEMGDEAALSLPPEEQYLVATGRTHFGGLAFD